MSITLRSNICCFSLHTLKCPIFTPNSQIYKLTFKILQLLDDCLTRPIGIFNLKTSHTTVTDLSSINLMHTNEVELCTRMSFLTSTKFCYKNQYFYRGRSLGDWQPRLKSDSLATDLAAIPSQTSTFISKVSGV